MELELKRNGISKWNWNCERNGKNSGTVHALYFTYIDSFFPLLFPLKSNKDLDFPLYKGRKEKKSKVGSDGGNVCRKCPMGEKGKEGKEETCISMGNFDFLVPFPLLLWGKGYLWNFQAC